PCLLVSLSGLPAKSDVERQDLLLIEWPLVDRDAEVQSQRHRAGQRRNDAKSDAGGDTIVGDVELAFDGAVIDEADQEELVVGQDRNLILGGVQEGELTAHVEVVLEWTDAAERKAAQAVETAGVKAIVNRRVVAGPLHL